jgi:hypothetical protein
MLAILKTILDVVMTGKALIGIKELGECFVHIQGIEVRLFVVYALVAVLA